MPYDFILEDSFFITQINEHNVKLLINDPYFLLFCVESGEIELQTIQWKDNLQKGKLYLFGPQYLLSVNVKKKFRASCIGFSLNFFQRDANDCMMDIFNLFFFNMGKTPVELTLEDNTKYYKLSQLLEDEINDEKSSSAIIHALLKIVLLNLVKKENIYKSSPDINIQRLHDFFILLQNSYLNEKKVNFYASQLSLSTRRLNQILHKYLKKSASYMIQEYVLNEAKRLLYNNQLTINEVADYLGFEDRAYFSRFFKKKAGLSPKFFKQKVLHA